MKVNKFGSKMRGILTALLLIGLLSGTAMASSTVNAYTGVNTFTYNETGIGNGKLSLTYKVEMIQANGTIHPPNADGTPGGGDSPIKDGTIIAAPGTFYVTNTVANNTVIYMRAWNAATVGAATRYGDSVTKTVVDASPPGVINWEVPDFATTSLKPAIPPIPVSSAATLVTNNTFSANWAASVGATGYYLDVATDAGFNSILANYNNKNVGNVITAPVSGLTANTTYYYRVRATNANGTSASSNVINLTTKLSAPTNLTTSAITKTGATANWNAVAGATSYTVSYGTNVAADNLGTLPTASNSVALPNLSAGTTYYWKALATNAGGSSAYSAPVSFTTVVNAPAAPTNLSATPAQTSATVSWTAPAGPVSSYTISYGTDVNATNGGTISPATNPDDIPNLAPGTTYYVKVSATNAGGTGPYSNTATFTTVAPNAPQIDSTSWEQNKDTGYTYGTLNLNGSKFGANQGGSSVELRFQGGQYFTLPNANVYYWSDGKIQIGIPQNVTANYAVAGNTDVRLTVNGQTASTTFVLKPKVYSVTPNSGPVGTKVVIEGTGFNPVAASNSVGFSGTPAAGTKVTQGTNVDTLEVTVPQGAATGQLLITVNGQSSNTNFDWGNKDQIVFTVIVPGQPIVTSVNPSSGNPGQTITVTIKGENNNWTGDMKAKVQVSGNDVTVNNATASDPNTIIASLTIAGNAAEGPRTISVNGAAGSATLTVSNQVNPGGPSVSTVLPSPATIGQTITISGSNLGDNMGASTVTIGGKTAKPTAWVKDSITVAVPTGVASGTAVVAVTVNGVTANSSVTIDTSKIMVDDFEGGDVGTFAAPAADSGYYVFDKYDAQYNANIKSSSYPDMAANTANPKAGQKSAELKYSYGSRSADPQYVGVNGDWGGGWGGKLANTLNLSGATKFGFQVRWDGSANDLNLAFKDSDGTVYTAAVSNGRLTAANASYTEIIVNSADFAADQYNKGANPAMDWANIIEYQVTYKSKNASANKHYIDSIIAYMPGGSPGPNPVTGEAPVINSISPSAAPAGTMITVTGSRFGSPQGSSTLTFTNKTTGVSYPADIVNWNDGTIQAIVPTKAVAGDYEIKVKRESIAQGVVTAFESAPAAFQVTASAAEVATVYPNPFNAGKESVNISITNSANATNIGYYLYDMTARLVWKQVIATKQTTWDGRDIYSATVGDGAYILRVVNEDNKTLLAKGKILVVKH